MSKVPAPQLHLPADFAEDNRRYLLWSTDGFPDLVNGRSSVQPESTAALIAAMDGFPDRASVALLRERGVESVILHLARLPGSPQEGAEKRPIQGLGVSRRRVGEVLVYELLPNASSPVTGAGAGSAEVRR